MPPRLSLSTDAELVVAIALGRLEARYGFVGFSNGSQVRAAFDVEVTAVLAEHSSPLGVAQCIVRRLSSTHAASQLGRMYARTRGRLLLPRTAAMSALGRSLARLELEATTPAAARMELEATPPAAIALIFATAPSTLTLPLHCLRRRRRRPASARHRRRPWPR